MTNDGTKGDKVLEFFGVNNEKIVFLPNGISEYLQMKKKVMNYEKTNNNKIRLVTISRLIRWKRVFLSVEIMNIIINKFNRKEFI
jgi:glycosyltransferase involved in cell wall biosynthesis